MKTYTHKQIVNQIKKLVEKETKKPSNPHGENSWDHILQVLKYSKQLAPKLKANKEIVEIAALLHDISSIKEGQKDHHINGAKEAERILKKFNCPKEKIEQVKHCIYTHRASTNIKRETPEAECLASADATDHFERIPALFYLVFVEYKMGIKEGETWIKEKLERDWKKLHPKAKELMKNKYKAIKQCL